MLVILSSKIGTEVLPKILTQSVSSPVIQILQIPNLEQTAEQQHAQNHNYQGRLRFE